MTKRDRQPQPKPAAKPAKAATPGEVKRRGYDRGQALRVMRAALLVELAKAGRK